MRVFKKILLAMLVCCSVGSELHAQKNTLLNGSLIITLVSNDTIWIGADSRTTSLTEKGYTVNELGMCKIHSTNNVVYAMAGHVRYADDSFNFLTIMDKVVQEQPNFDTAMLEFKDKATKEINSILKKFSTKSINTLIKKNNGSFLSAVAITFVDGEKKIKEMRFSIEKVSNCKYNVLYKETFINDSGALRFVGHATKASKYINENSFYFGNGLNIPVKIRGLIELESTSGSITVGLPADVISIYNNGFKRVISSGLCQ